MPTGPGETQRTRLDELETQFAKGELPPHELYELAGLERAAYGDVHGRAQHLRDHTPKSSLAQEPESTESFSAKDRQRLAVFLSDTRTPSNLLFAELKEYIGLLQGARRHYLTVLQWLQTVVSRDPSGRLEVQPLPSANASPIGSEFDDRYRRQKPDQRKNDKIRLPWEQNVELPLGETHFESPMGDGPGYHPRFSMFYKDARNIVADGVRYMPIQLAACVAQTSDATLRRWIEKAVSFDGKAIASHVSEVTRQLYVSEESVKRLENRFLKWPAKKPAGAVTIGETADKTGYIPVPDVARLVGVSTVSVWGWANKGEVTTSHQHLDVIRCPISDQLYLRERDAFELAEARSDLKVKRARKRRDSDGHARQSKS